MLDAVGTQFPELPGWEFSVTKTSAGAYSVRAIRDGGIRGESSGDEPDELIAELRGWASRVDDDLRSRARRMSFRCRCCGQPTLAEEPSGTYEICPNCGWEDDPVQSRDPDYAGGANGFSLRSFRRHWLQEMAINAYWETGNVHGRPVVEVVLDDGTVVSLIEGVRWLESQLGRGVVLTPIVQVRERTVAIVMTQGTSNT